VREAKGRIFGYEGADALCIPILGYSLCSGRARVPIDFIRELNWAGWDHFCNVACDLLRDHPEYRYSAVADVMKPGRGAPTLLALSVIPKYGWGFDEECAMGSIARLTEKADVLGLTNVVVPDPVHWGEYEPPVAARCRRLRAALRAALDDRFVMVRQARE
jgi:hypothetical protein